MTENIPSKDKKPWSKEDFFKGLSNKTEELFPGNEEFQ